MHGGDRRCDGDAHRPAELLGGIEQPRGEPGLLLGHAGQAGDRNGDEAERRASAGNEERPREGAPEVPCTGACVTHRTPPPISAIPAAITGPAEKRVTSIGASPASATEVTEAASQASPACRAE